jgi:LysR family transcriptional regulator, glycine cleavage system transcriptional activator
MFLRSATLPSLRFFEAAARHLSFKQAAIELHVTQGAVSQQIKHLEETLGCRLFYRQTRQVDLTEEGQRLVAVVRRALAEIDQEARAISAGRAETELRVRAGPSFALSWLVPRLGNFYAQHPGIKLSVIAAHGYFDPDQRDFDVAIERVAGKVSGLHSEVLMEESLAPVCSPAYLAEHAFLKEPTDLARCTLLHDSQAWVGAGRDAEWQHWLREVGANGIDSTRGQFFSLANMSIEAALGDQGIAMGRIPLIGNLLERRQLVLPFGEQVVSPAKYCLLYPREMADRPHVRALIRWLQETATLHGCLQVLLYQR